MTASTLSPLNWGRVWCLAVILALVGVLVGPQAGPARADDKDKADCSWVKGPARDFCQDRRGEQRAKDPGPCQLLDGLARKLCEDRSSGNTDPGGLTPSCKAAPPAALAGRGSASWAATPPRKAPAPLDPHKSEARSHIYEQYGLGDGLSWHTYDLKCQGMSSMITSAGADYETKLANGLLDMSKWWTGLAIGLQQEATGDGYLSKLNTVFGDATKAVAKAVYRPWIAISLLLLGLGIVYRARSKNMPDIVKSVAWALLVMAVTSVAFNYPQKAGQLADDALTKTVGQIQQGVAGDSGHGSSVATSQGNLLTNAIIYQAWAEGTFGDSQSKTAKKYGMQLLDAQSLTWAESRLPTKERNTVITAKGRTWESLASKIKDEDPDAYKYLTGEADGRMGTAVNAAFGAIPSNWYSVASSIVIICGRLILKMIVIFLPAIAPIAIHRQLGGTLRTLGKSGAAAVINAPLFVLAASVDTLLIQVLLRDDSHIPSWFAIVLIWIITIMLWAISKPFRRLSSMVSPNQDWFNAGTGVLGKAKAGAVGAALGYAKGKMSARQIGRMVNGKGGGRSGGAAAEEPEDGELVERSIRREGESEWSVETPYEPGPAPQTQDEGYWPLGRDDGDTPWSFEPQESVGDETSQQQPTYVPETGPAAGGSRESQHTAEAASSVASAPSWTAPSSTTSTAPTTSPERAVGPAPSPAPALPPAAPADRPRANVPPQGPVPPPEGGSSTVHPSGHEGDRPVPMAPQVTEADGSVTFVLYSPSNGYNTVRTDTGFVVGPEEGTDA
ncbi:hypothetical protein [Streptomyces sp. NEAU-S7GS2]|uniref:hypothetical protein n=1 Tax=Streptomyces sp. NEAU-S7GS2 TaxID=2202000 RepID=UPI000D6F6F5E|nr:hypothetical protein [Streptomyces sp. NEAU-S7GS2]AWN32601.1 hypothetical protein DKG71_42230 [Streptomyces sp. NEAU-S7GS2]